MNDLNDALLAALEPFIRQAVDEAVKKAQLQWQWRTVRQAAELLDVSESAIYSRYERGQLPGRKLDGRLYIDMKKLDRQLRELR